MPQRKRLQTGKGPGKRVFNPVVYRIPGGDKPKLAIVLKCDSVGGVEAVSGVLASPGVPGVELEVIHSGVGAVTKQDILMAVTGSRLVVGFNVSVNPGLENRIKEQGVEVRLYNVIYRLGEDLREIARSLVPSEPEEVVTGTCGVIAVFRSGKGVVLGCEVLAGALQTGKNFRVHAAMGPVYSARIESMQVNRKPVREARPGQQVGIRADGFEDARVGDFIECYEVAAPKKKTWTPRGNIIRLESSRGENPRRTAPVASE